MHAKNSIIHDSTYWQNIEAQTKFFPDFDIVSSFAFIIKSVHPIDTLTLMIASKHKEVVWVFDFIRKHQTYSLNTLLTSIHVISNEKKLLLRTWIARNIE